MLESALESVVVHAVGAVCVRRARCVLPPGPPAAPDAAVRVRVEGLPIALYDHSLRGRVVSGPPGLRVTDARVVRVAAPRQDRELPTLRLELEEAEDRLDRLRERRDRLAEEVGQVAELRAVPPQQRRGDPPRWAPVESLLALANFVDGRLALLHERLRAVEAELSGAEYEVDVLAHRLEAASSALPAARAGESAAAVLTLERSGEAAEHAGSRDEQDSAEAELEVEYHVPGATWSPVYQLRLDDTASGSGSGSGSGGTLVLRACVAQRTGEDWTGVRLGLSTADLLRRTDVPRLRSLRIGRRQEEPAARGWREPPPGLEELFAGYDAAVPPGPLPVPVPARAGGAPPPVAGAAPATGAAAEPETGRTLPEAHHGFAAYGAPAAASAPAPLAPGLPRGSSGRGSGGSRVPAVPASPTWPLSPAGPGRGHARLLRSDAGRSGRARPARQTAARTGRAGHGRRRAPAAGRVRGTAGAPLPRGRRTAIGRFLPPPLRHGRPGGRGRGRGLAHRPRTRDPGGDGAGVRVRAVGGPDRVRHGAADQRLRPPAARPGLTDVVVDGGFVLTTPLPTLAPGECRRVGTGAVESVKAARRTRLRESTAGLRGGTTVLDHTVEVELANRLAHRITVEVRERVPVGTDKEVRIEERPAEPPWTAAEGPLDDPDGGDGRHVRGVRIWRVELEPGRTTVLRGGYEVRIPAGKALVGGNRRD
ncbi:DUF4139 domain-containing protein [Streptomyces radiopugnans]|nr:DUF4139 domain-containing protein [Streptomyces radiopugnans]